MCIITSINLLLVTDFHDDKFLTHSKCGESRGDELAKPLIVRKRKSFNFLFSSVKHKNKVKDK